MVSKRSKSTSPYVRAKRPSKARSLLVRFFQFFIFALLLIGALVAVKAFLSLKNVSVANIGDGSPLLNLTGIAPNALAGEGDGRINILFIGVGGQSHPGGALADTIMVASIDPESKAMALLSIPRDLLVDYPKPHKGESKINAIHAYGERNEKKIPGGGPELMKKTVSEILDIPVHYFIRADFEGFKDVVDLLGGVDVEVEKAISDPYYPAPNLRDYDPFYITKGEHKLNGEKALKYVRSRETTSDFDRAKRQQQVLSAIKDKSLSIGFLSNPSKVIKSLDILQKHVKTDLSINELERLIVLIKDIDSSKVTSAVLDNSPNGPLKSINRSGYYLVTKTGDYSEVQRIAHDIFSDPFIEKEKADIAVLNASQAAGKGNEVATNLERYNYEIAYLEKAPKVQDKSIIYDTSNGSKKLTLALLKKRLNLSVSTNVPADIKNVVPKADLIVVVGDDYRQGKNIFIKE